MARVRLPTMPSTYPSFCPPPPPGPGLEAPPPGLDPCVGHFPPSRLRGHLRPPLPPFPDRAYRGFIPSKRVYLHGLKPHLLVDDGKFVHEVNLTPGSWHDLAFLPP